MAGNPIDSQTANGEIFIGSREKSDNAYGQNGYHGPSSDLPGQKTRMNRDFGLDADPSDKPGDWQTRAVKAEAYPTHPGMKGPAAPAKIPDNNVRRASTRVSGSSFQRR